MKKRILLLADSASPHTQKWATGLTQKGYTVGLFSLNKTGGDWYKSNKKIVLLSEPDTASDASFFLNKLGYLLVLPKLLRKIKEFGPDLLHAHYASSYGLLGALSKFRPFVISAWGSDVFEFPAKSFVHRFLFKFNLRKADKLLATSHALKMELRKYTSRTVEIIPFGVDTAIFYPSSHRVSDERVLYIGAIKAMEDQYGIQTIIAAANILKNKVPSLAFKIFLIGGGSRTEQYKKTVESLDLSRNIEFTGKIPFRSIPEYHNLLDIFLNVSIVNESFGVSVIEAMACEKPVIVSDAPGLKEIMNNDDRLGIVIDRQNEIQLANAIIRLMLSPELRQSMGKAGRQHVLEHYDFNSCLDQMAAVYKSLTGSITGESRLSLAVEQYAKEPLLK